MDGDYQELVFEASQLKPTYVFSEATGPSSIAGRDRKVEELAKLMASSGDGIIDIACILDPESGEFLVYTGNVEHAFALEHGYRLRARVIRNQEELDEYAKDTGQVSNLGITGFDGLLKYLKLCAEYPAVERDMPKDQFEELKRIQQSYQNTRTSQALSDLAGWDDDD